MVQGVIHNSLELPLTCRITLDCAKITENMDCLSWLSRNIVFFKNAADPLPPCTFVIIFGVVLMAQILLFCDLQLSKLPLVWENYWVVLSSSLYSHSAIRKTGSYSGFSSSSHNSYLIFWVKRLLNVGVCIIQILASSKIHQLVCLLFLILLSLGRQTRSTCIHSLWTDDVDKDNWFLLQSNAWFPGSHWPFLRKFDLLGRRLSLCHFWN